MPVTEWESGRNNLSKESESSRNSLFNESGNRRNRLPNLSWSRVDIAQVSGYGEAVCPENQAVDGTVYYKDKNGITNNSEYFSCSDFKSLFLNM